MVHTEVGTRFISNRRASLSEEVVTALLEYIQAIRE